MLNTELVIQRFFGIVEQGLHTTKAFSAFYVATLGRKLGMLGRLGGDTAKIGDPN